MKTFIARRGVMKNEKGSGHQMDKLPDSCQNQQCLPECYGQETVPQQIKA